MKTYNLRIREHRETGILGIAFVGGLNGRDYFEPGLSGEQIAHDVLEHPATAHPNRIIDELLALGGCLAGRIQHGYLTRGGVVLSMDDLRWDIASLASHCITTSEPFCAKPCKGFLKDPETMEEVRKSVVSGLREACDEYVVDGGEKIEDLFDVDSTVGWICKGVQLFRKRFSSVSIFDVSNHLFPTIAKECDQWLRGGVQVGDEAKLIVDISGMRAELVDDWYDDVRDYY